MKKYKIQVTRTTTLTLDLELKYENDKEALDAAEDIAHDTDFSIYSEKDAEYNYDILEIEEI